MRLRGAMWMNILSKVPQSLAASRRASESGSSSLVILIRMADGDARAGHNLPLMMSPWQSCGNFGSDQRWLREKNGAGWCRSTFFKSDTSNRFESQHVFCGIGHTRLIFFTQQVLVQLIFGIGRLVLHIAPMKSMKIRKARANPVALVKFHNSSKPMGVSVLERMGVTRGSGDSCGSWKMALALV